MVKIFEKERKCIVKKKGGKIEVFYVNSRNVKWFYIVVICDDCLKVFVVVCKK